MANSPQLFGLLFSSGDPLGAISLRLVYGDRAKVRKGGVAGEATDAESLIIVSLGLFAVVGTSPGCRCWVWEEMS